MALLWLRPDLQGGKALPFAVISYSLRLYSYGVQLIHTSFPGSIAAGYNFFKHHQLGLTPLTRRQP